MSTNKSYTKTLKNKQKQNKNSAPKRSWKIKIEPDNKSEEVTNSDLLPDTQPALQREFGYIKATPEVRALITDSIDDSNAQILADLDVARQVLPEVAEFEERHILAPAVVTPAAFDEEAALLNFRNSCKHKLFVSYGPLKGEKNLRANSTFWAHSLGITKNVVDWPDKLSLIIQEESFAYQEPRPTFQQMLARFTFNALSYFSPSQYSYTAISRVLRFGVLAGAVVLSAIAVNSYRKPRTATGILFAALLSYPYMRPKSVTRKAQLFDSCVGRLGDFSKSDGKFVYKLEMHKCTKKPLFLGFSFLDPRFINVGRGCSCNESVAVAERQCTKTIETTADRGVLWERASAALKKRFTFPKYDCSFTTQELREKFYAAYPEGRRKVLQAAAAALDVGNDYDADSKIFVKREVIAGKSLQDFQPRAISAKSDMYLMRTGPQYKEWWNQVVDTKFPTVLKSLESRFIYTGKMTGDEVGLLVTFMERNGYYPTEMDCSRFDGHVEVEALEAEFNLYDDVLPSHLVKDLRLQLKTKGKSMTGAVKFSFAGKRASGVINTSAGNTISAWMMMALYFENEGIDDFYVLQIGDDNLTFTKKRLNEQSLVSLFSDLGHKLKVIARDRTEYDHLEYCSGRFWRVGSQRVLQAKFGKMLAKTFISVKPIADQDLLPYCKAIVRGLFYYKDFPGMGPLIRGLGLEDSSFKSRDMDNPHAIQLRIAIDVDRSEMAEQFQNVYGICLDDFEEELSSFDFSVMGVIHSSPLVDAVMRADGCLPPL